MKKKLLVALFALALMPALVSAEDEAEFAKTIWECYRLMDVITESSPAMVLVQWGDDSYIEVFDERIPAKVTLDGLLKRWAWGFDDNKNSYDYAVYVDSSGEATYHDFSAVEKGEPAEASDMFLCNKRSLSENN